MDAPLRAALRTPPDLEALRKQRGLTLQQISQDTKISVTYLESIELGRFDRLPGGIYDRSYIRQYARAIDFNPAELLDWYYAVTPVTEKLPDPPRKSPVQRVNEEAVRDWT